MLGVVAGSIFTPAGGFIRRGGFDFTCNPYLGCTFVCRYCYASALPQNPLPRSEWGRWFAGKVNAGELARRSAHRVAGKAVYLSSVTDPYQPAERSGFLTRSVLEAMVPVRPRLVVQTRGPLVVRDIDLLTQFDSVRVNVTIPTDSEDVRVRFEPKAPTLESRWLAVRELSAAGVPVGITVTPTLPVVDVHAFADRLVDARPAVLVTQEFHDAGGRFGADTDPAVRGLSVSMAWGARSIWRSAPPWSPGLGRRSMTARRGSSRRLRGETPRKILRQVPFPFRQARGIRRPKRGVRHASGIVGAADSSRRGRLPRGTAGAGLARPA